MNDEMLSLARRAVACKGWRWMPGMGRADGYRYVGQGVWAKSVSGCSLSALHAPGQIPDLSDPATLGCLLALVREAWGDPTICAYSVLDGWEASGHLVRHSSGEATATCWNGPTEAEALVAALEAAP